MGLAYRFRGSVHYHQVRNMAVSRQTCYRRNWEFHIFIWRPYIRILAPRQLGQAHSHKATPTPTMPDHQTVPLPGPSIYKPSEFINKKEVDRFYYVYGTIHLKCFIMNTIINKVTTNQVECLTEMLKIYSCGGSSS